MVEQLNLGLSGRALEVLLRLPPLYLMDAILLQEMSLTAPLFGMDGRGSDGGGMGGADYASKVATLTTQEGHKVRVTEAPRGANFSLNLESALGELSPSLEDGSQSQALEEVYFKLYGGTADAAVLPYYLANLLFGSSVYLLAAFILTLSLRQLLVFYGYLLAVVCLPLSYLSHAIMAETLGQLSAMKDVSSGDPANAEWFLHRLLASSSMAASLSLDARAIVANYLVQTTLGLVLASVLKLHFDNRDLLAKVVTLSMLSPNVFAVLRVPPPVLDMTVFLSLVVPIMLTAVALGSVAGHAFQAVIHMYRRKRQLIHNFGLNVFLETEWNRLRVPSLLRTFWVTRIGLHLFLECLNSSQVSLQK